MRKERGSASTSRPGGRYGQPGPTENSRGRKQKKKGKKKVCKRAKQGRGSD